MIRIKLLLLVLFGNNFACLSLKSSLHHGIKLLDPVPQLQVDELQALCVLIDNLALLSQLRVLLFVDILLPSGFQLDLIVVVLVDNIA